MYMLRDLHRISFTLLGLAAFAWGGDALAQPADPAAADPGAADPTAADPAAPEAEEAPAAEPPAAEPPAAEQPAETTAAPPPGPPPPPESLIPDGEAPPQRSMPPAFPPAIPSIDYGARLRTALMLQNPEDPEKFNDIGEFLEGDLYMSGQIHRYWSWQFAMTFSYGTASTTTFAPLDVIGKFEPAREFNIWVGRMLVQADRFSPSGPWGIDEFFYPGFFPFVAGPPALPKAGPVGRDVGVNVWGAPFGGHLKYYLGAYQLQDPTLSPLLSGRLQLSLLSPEPAFYQRTTYYGTKDLVSVGVGAQSQKNGSVQPVPPAAAGMPPAVPLTDDYSSLTADFNVEKTLGDSGTVSVVGQYSKFQGDYQLWDSSWIASVGYMLPKTIGIGKVRGTLRYQSALETIDGAEASNLLDAQLSYIIAAWYARLGLGFRHGNTWMPGNATAGTAATTQASNMIYLGLTLADP
jgi:hypothetical protein